MMMYITGVSAFAESGLETLYCCTTPGIQSQVDAHLRTIRGWFRRSLRLPQRRHLTWSARSAAGSTAASAVGSAAAFTRGPYPAPQPGLQQGRRRTYQYFGATADLKTFRTVDCRAHPTSGSTENGAHTTTNSGSQRAVHMHFLGKEGARASCQHVTLRNCRGVPASTTTVKNANDTVGRPRSMLKPSSPWLHRHGTPPRSGNGMPNVTAQLYQPQKQLFITGEVLSEAGRSQRKGFSIQQTECACPCCVLYTLSRAAKRPLAASLLATLALGHRRWATGVA